MGTLVSTGQLTINDYNDGMTVYLSNEGMSLPASETGVVTDFTGASSTLFIFLGQVDDSASWTVSATPSTGVAGSLGAGAAARTFTVSSLTAESAYVDFDATKIGFLPLTRRFSISKARKGANGSDGTPGGNGTPGTDGTSAKKAYCASSTPTTSTAPAATTGVNSVPAVNQGGVVGTWVLVTPTIAAGQYLWVCDGSYSPTTNQITWSVPYWGSLRVGNLSAIAVDTGTLNVSGSISSTNGNYSLNSDGSAIFKSLTITGAGANPILAPGDTTIKMGGLPSGVKNTEAQFTPFKTWEFRNTYDGFTFGGATPATAADSVIITSTSTDPTMTTSVIAVDGKVNDRIRMRVKRNAGSSWQGGMYWANAGHGIVGGSVLNIADTTTSSYSVLEWDMSAISDWTSNINTQLRFDLGQTSADIFEIDWISIGKMGPASTSKDTSNLIDLSWWVRDGVHPWTPNGISEYNRLVMTTTDVGGLGPKGVNDVVWFCQETVGDSDSGGGWDATMQLTLDPTKTYRFVVPIKRIDGTGSAYWGPHNVCDLNTTTAAGNPYFANSPISAGTWLLFVGYLFPAGSTGNTNDGAGIYNCDTGALVTAGTNFNLKPGITTYTHRAYQYYATVNSKQIFGRPMINLVDGTEPSLREYFSASAVLNSNQLWSQVSGPGRPENDATVGANSTNLNVGVGTNLLFNSMPNNGLAFTTPDGWGNHGQTLESVNPQFIPRGHSFDIYSPLRQCSYIHISIVTPTIGTYQDVIMNNSVASKTVVYPSRRYEASAFISAHRCSATIRVNWYNSAGAFLSESAFSNAVTIGPTYTAGNEFPRAALFVTSPSTAYYASIIIRQTHNGGADPYTFFSGLYFGEALAAQTVFTPWAEGSPYSVLGLDYKGDLNASSDITLIGRGVTVNGNSLTKTGVDGWYDDAYSKESYTGGAFATATIVNTGELMFGLNTDPTANRSYDSLDYAWYTSNAGNLGAYESNVSIPGISTYVPGDVLSVTYDGTNVRYLKNGVVLRTVAANITLPLYFDSSLCSVGIKLANVQFGPMTSNNWSAVGGMGKPSDNATSDITLVGRGTIITGNKITNSTGSGPWVNDAYSKNGYTGGACATASVAQAGLSLMFGLNSDPLTDRSYGSLDYAFYFEGVNVYIYESNINKGVFSTSYTTTDVFSVIYDGAAITYYQNGTKLRTVTVDITSALYFDSSFYHDGAAIYNVGFAPMTNVSWITNGYTEGGMGHVVRPQGGSFSSIPVAGAIAINLPTAVFNSNTMLKFKVEIYEYDVGKSASYVLSGYNYPIGPLWYNVTAEYNGPVHARKRVRFGQNAAGTRNVIYIGDGTSEANPTTWQYPQVRITEVSTGYSNYEHTKWMTGWSINIDATPYLAGINNQVVTPSVGGGMAAIDQITASNVASFIGASAIGNAQFGGDLYSTNWNGNTNTSGAGWYLERVGNFYGYNVKLRGAIMGGSYNAWAWPASGQNGFYLGPEGLLLGNNNDGKFVQIDYLGNFYAPKFTIVNGNANFSGILAVGATSASPLSSLTTAIGTLRARTSGGRTEIADDIIRVYDSSNAIRIKIGYLL